MTLYLPGWGFKVDVLVYYFPTGKYQAIAWSLGIVRLLELLDRRRFRLDNVLLLACPRSMDKEEVEKFITDYQKDPQRARYSFYRKCLWGSGVSWQEAERFFSLKGELTSDVDALETLEQLTREPMDLSPLVENSSHIDVVLAKNDLVVPYRSQLALAKELSLRHDSVNITELDTGHFLFPNLTLGV